MLCPLIYSPIQQEHYRRALVGYTLYVQLFRFHFPYYITLPLGGSEVAPPLGPGQFFRTCPIFPQAWSRWTGVELLVGVSAVYPVLVVVVALPNPFP